MREFTNPTVPTRDAGGVRVRPATPGDRERLGDMLGRLSPQTIYERFHAPYQRVPEWFLDQFIGLGHHEGAFLVALAADDIVGHAMYVGSDVGPDGGRDAEIAVVVEDGWQTRGVGKLLLRELAERARRRGVESFTGTALAENRRVRGLIGALFSSAEYKTKGGSYYFRIPLRSAEISQPAA